MSLLEYQLSIYLSINYSLILFVSKLVIAQTVRLQSSSAFPDQSGDYPQSPSEESAKARQLYPEIQPYNSGFLKVDDLHELYYEECGNKDGQVTFYRLQYTRYGCLAMV